MHYRIDIRPAAQTGAGRGLTPRARVSILALAVVVVTIAAVDLIAQWNAALAVCTVPGCRPPQLAQPGIDELADAGIALTTWATLTAIPAALSAAAGIGLALLVALRGTDRGARIVPFVLLVAALAPSSAFAPWPLLVAILAVTSPLSLFVLLGLFPDGAFRPRWTIAPVALAAVWIAITSIPAIADAVASNEQPWASAYGAVFALALAGIVASYVVRYRRGTPHARRSMLLLLVVLLLMAVPGAAFSIYQGAAADSAGIGTVTGSALASLSSLFVLLVYAAIGLAVIRDGAYGVRVVFNRVLLGLIGLGIALAVYVATAAAASVLLSGWLPQALAAAAAALALFVCLRWVERGLDRLVYGDAEDPDRLAARLSAAVTEAEATAELVPDVLELLARRLRLPWLELDDRAGVAPPAGALRVELAPAGPSLTVGARPGQRRFGRRDRQALRAAGPALLSALAVVRLTAELSDSRRRIVTAAEGERRVLRRELHDELGPTLAAARHRVQAARSGLPADSVAAPHLARAEASLTASVELIRTLARRLRPPALDERGLGGAIESAVDDLGMTASLEIDAGALPDAVEVGVYRIAVEALANAARHSGASRVGVTVVRGADAVELTVTDDGIGGAAASAAGVGVTAMRERAAELGGWVAVAERDGGGTLVSARLPVERTPA